MNNKKRVWDSSPFLAHIFRQFSFFFFMYIFLVRARDEPQEGKFYFFLSPPLFSHIRKVKMRLIYLSRNISFDRENKPILKSLSRRFPRWLESAREIYQQRKNPSDDDLFIYRSANLKFHKWKLRLFPAIFKTDQKIFHTYGSSYAKLHFKLRKFIEINFDGIINKKLIQKKNNPLIN